MPSLLLDLLAHRAWADDAHLRTIAAHPSAREDAVLRARLFHMHSVQDAFLWVIGGIAAFVPADAATMTTFASLASFARACHARERAYLDTFNAEHASVANERIAIPFFRDPPLALTRAEVLAQSALHSLHHRAQNASRLRELGCAPPPIDLIVWYRAGRPAPTADA